jgi:hypothetical protein
MFVNWHMPARLMKRGLGAIIVEYHDICIRADIPSERLEIRFYSPLCTTSLEIVLLPAVFFMAIIVASVVVWLLLKES